MTWCPRISKRVKSFLKKHPELAPKVFEIIETLARDPFNNNLDIKKIKGSLAEYRVRFGKYRIVYELDHDYKVIDFTKADTRGDIY